MTRLSIIIVTRNRSNALDGLLRSLAIQAKKPYEIIIVDNDSSDGTKEVVRKYSDIPKTSLLNKNLLKTNLSNTNKPNMVYVLEKKIGIPYARNTGLMKSRGELIVFIDDDCFAPKDWIENILKIKNL